MNCARAKSRPSACANDRAASVLPSPGKSSISTWPLARTAASTRLSACRLPTTAWPTRSSTSVRDAGRLRAAEVGGRGSAVPLLTASSVTERLDPGQVAVDLVRREPADGQLGEVAQLGVGEVGVAGAGQRDQPVAQRRSGVAGVEVAVEDPAGGRWPRRRRGARTAAGSSPSGAAWVPAASRSSHSRAATAVGSSAQPSSRGPKSRRVSTTWPTTTTSARSAARAHQARSSGPLTGPPRRRDRIRASASSAARRSCLAHLVAAEAGLAVELQQPGHGRPVDVGGVEHPQRQLRGGLPLAPGHPRPLGLQLEPVPALHDRVARLALLEEPRLLVGVLGHGGGDPLPVVEGLELAGRRLLVDAAPGGRRCAGGVRRGRRRAASRRGRRAGRRPR